MFVVLLLTALGISEAQATGALFVRPLRSTQTYDLMSIKTYDATATIEDQIAVTHVDQTFVNNTPHIVESTFIFPLPEGAVITELIYWFNGKKYIASLREREEAQKSYNDKVRKLIDPALLQDIGENVFKLNIAPINPNSEVRFEITYAEILTYEFGSVNYRFILRTAELSPQPLERISVTIDATTSRTFKHFDSPSHANTPAASITQISESHYRVEFGDENYAPDRDLLIRFETHRAAVDLNLLTYVPVPADSFGVDNFYAVWITPPDTISDEDMPPRDIVFVADVSSSMEGVRIEQLKEALLGFLDELRPIDRFNIVVFSTGSVAFRTDLVIADAEELAAARVFVEGLGAVGLTNISEALTTALGMSYTAGSAGIMVFMTDGYPTWGELEIDRILQDAAERNGGRVRIFPFGIGDEVSKTLLNGLASDNGGYATYIRSDDQIADAIANYFRRIALPVLSDLRIDYGGLQTYDRYDDELSDLFWGTQVIQFGRYKQGGTFTVTMAGLRGTDTFTVENTATFGNEPGGNRAVARLWAKKKIDHLLTDIAIYGEKDELVNAIIDLSIRFGVLSPYTALYSDPDDDPPVSEVEREEKLIPLRLHVEANVPNPFSEVTRIAFHIPPGSVRDTRVEIYDINGRLVCTLFAGELMPGRHEVSWNGTDQSGELVPTGTYICRVSTNGTEASITMKVVR
jgi:Ca-activated chloride channel family protein